MWIRSREIVAHLGSPKFKRRELMKRKGMRVVFRWNAMASRDPAPHIPDCSMVNYNILWGSALCEFERELISESNQRRGTTDKVEVPRKPKLPFVDSNTAYGYLCVTHPTNDRITVKGRTFLDDGDPRVEFQNRPANV